MVPGGGGVRLASGSRHGPEARIVRAAVLRAALGPWGRCDRMRCWCQSRAIDGARRCAALTMRPCSLARHLHRAGCHGARCWCAKIRCGKLRGMRTNDGQSMGDSASSQIRFVFQIESCWSMTSAQRVRRRQTAHGSFEAPGPDGSPSGCWLGLTDKNNDSAIQKRCLLSPLSRVDSLATP